MNLKASNRKNKLGMPPGALVHIGVKKIDDTKMTLIDYDADSVHTKVLKNLGECIYDPHKCDHRVLWLNLDGIHESDTIAQLGKIFQLHPLLLEDVMNTDERTKIDHYGDYIYLVIKMVFWDDTHQKIMIEQISMIIGKGFLITLQEREGDVFDPIRQRIHVKNSRFHQYGADYLAYAILDNIVDHYFLAIEKINDVMESLEEEVMKSTHMRTIHEIQTIKKELIYLRKAIRPLREVVASLDEQHTKLISPANAVYFRDVHDHILNIVEYIEVMREILSDLSDTFQFNVGNRMNEVMKVLTVISTIFIPLTFIAGIYGMNFENMPELKSPYGYFVCLAVMFALGIVSAVYFKIKKWF